MEHAFEAFIFDLDGTLLHTLPDLVVLTNLALHESGYPERTEGEILSFVGNGAKALLQQAVPEGTSAADIEAVMGRWIALYPDHGGALTKEYVGISALLHELQKKGKKLGVLSNRFDGGVTQLIDEHFPDVFSITHGVSEQIPRKPDPTGLLFAIAELGTTPDKTAYVGDSAGDMLTAHNAGAFALGVTWGYHSEEKLVAAKAEALVHNPEEILQFAADEPPTSRAI